MIRARGLAPTRAASRRVGAPRRTLAGVGAGLLAITLVGQLAPAVGAPASGVTAQAPANSIDHKVKVAKEQLAGASLALSRANASLDRAAGRLPSARAAVARAAVAVEQARKDEAAAQARLAAARHQVDLQNIKINIVQAKINLLMAKIGSLARQAYVSGGEQQTLAILLQTNDINSFTTQLESERRTARANSNLFDQAEAARQELAAQMAILQQVQAKADNDQAEASARTAAKQGARAQALDAAKSVQALVSQRASAAKVAANNRSSIRRVYNKLLDQQDRAHGRWNAHSSGTSRTARQAVAWAMRQVGGGAEYAGLCLGFVDAAYGATGGRQPRAIDQWYAAKRAGKAHPGDRNPPVGAQVFWLTGNPARHIAIYAGGGMVISTSVDNGRVGIVPMGYLDGWGPYIGWAEAYYP